MTTGNGPEAAPCHVWSATSHDSFRTDTDEIFDRLVRDVADPRGGRELAGTMIAHFRRSEGAFCDAIDIPAAGRCSGRVRSPPLIRACGRKDGPAGSYGVEHSQAQA